MKLYNRTVVLVSVWFLVIAGYMVTSLIWDKSAMLRFHMTASWASMMIAMFLLTRSIHQKPTTPVMTVIGKWFPRPWWPVLLGFVIVGFATFGGLGLCFMVEKLYDECVEPPSKSLR